MARRFPEDFRWGASTAAYQIEGAVTADGRGPSIWDKFSHLSGKIADGETGDVACDHYHRYAGDVALMRALNLNAYRFSTAWSRILPEGRGAVNRRGLEFYDRLVDAVADAGIEPWLCLYHWDLPQALEDRGGWQNRDTAHWYADYAQQVVRRLGDRVRHIATFAEPNVAAFKGYGDGDHAPGIRGRASALKAMHHMSVAHGLGIQALRAERQGLMLGNIYNLNAVMPLTDRERDRAAADMFDALWNKAFPDAQLLGRYPEPIAAEVAAFIQPGDMALIRQELDHLALDHEGRIWVRHDDDHPFQFAEVPPPAGRPVTETGREVAPDAFLEQLRVAKERYGDRPVHIGLTGAAFPDEVDAEGRIRDPRRIDYLRQHLGALLDAIAGGVPVKGCFVWSLLDGFAWSFGYAKRFGLVHVDRATQERRPKDGFRYYAEVAATGEPG